MSRATKKVPTRHHIQQRLILFFFQSIFARSKYLRGSLGFCDLCYRVYDAETVGHYACRTCENFTMCRRCHTYKRHTAHPTHQTTEISPDMFKHQLRDLHFGYTCRICEKSDFAGRRYQCAQCRVPQTFNVCSVCIAETELVHPNHSFVLVPNERKVHCNRLLLAYRSMLVLKQRGSKVGDLDELTGWTMFAAASIVARESLAIQKLTPVLTGSSRAMAVLHAGLPVSVNKLGAAFRDFMLQFYFEQLSQDTTAAMTPNIARLTLESPTTSDRSSHQRTEEDVNETLSELDVLQDEQVAFRRLRERLRADNDAPVENGFR